MTVFSSLSQIEQSDIKRLGIDISNGCSSSNFLITNNSKALFDSSASNIQILPISIAKKDKKSFIKKYYSQSIPKEKDKITKKIINDHPDGYYIHLSGGKTISTPIQTCLYTTRNDTTQLLHNLIILEEHTKATIFSTCLSKSCVKNNNHWSLTEIFLEAGAELHLLMIHDWGESSHVEPRTIITMDNGSKLIYDYVCISSPAIINSNPLVLMNGQNSTALLNSTVFSNHNSLVDVGGQVLLNSHNTHTEIISKAIAKGGKIINRGLIEGNQKDVFGHLECDGILLSQQSEIYAIPELKAKAVGAELSHEAAIGKINQDQIEYLMARGLSETQSTSLIINGFLPKNILKMNINLSKEIETFLKNNSSL